MNISRAATKLLTPNEREQHIDAELKRLRNVAWRMDALFFIPRTNFSIGLDNIFGLVPVIGDLATMGHSLWIVWKGWRLGATPGAVAFMLLNILADTLIGSIPLIGGIFDIWYNSNIRNVRLLEKNLAKRAASAAYATQRPTPSLVPAPSLAITA